MTTDAAWNPATEMRPNRTALNNEILLHALLEVCRCCLNMISYHLDLPWLDNHGSCPKPSNSIPWEHYATMLCHDSCEQDAGRRFPYIIVSPSRLEWTKASCSTQSDAVEDIVSHRVNKTARFPEDLLDSIQRPSDNETRDGTCTRNSNRRGKSTSTRIPPRNYRFSLLLPPQRNPSPWIRPIRLVSEKKTTRLFKEPLDS